MKEKIAVSGDLIIRQELWNDSPCSNCFGTACCRNLPLAALQMDRQSDFVSLILTSCYDGIFPALKKSGEWTVYLGRDCSHLNGDGRCSIHKSPYQSLICKSYDAHSCWYTDAFSPERFSTLIPFDTEMLIWFEKKYGLIQSGFSADFDWQELCSSAYEYQRNPVEKSNLPVESGTSWILSFRKSRAEQFLFLPPYKRPENIKQFELLSFRLGFPGVSLAVTDTHWAFLIKTELNKSRLNLVQNEYYPAIGHKNSPYSFDAVMKELRPFSEVGEQWVVLHQPDLDVLKALTVFDSAGKVRRWPSCRELLDALRSKSPNRAA